MTNQMQITQPEKDTALDGASPGLRLVSIRRPVRPAVAGRLALVCDAFV